MNFNFTSNIAKPAMPNTPTVPAVNTGVPPQVGFNMNNNGFGAKPATTLNTGFGTGNTLSNFGAGNAFVKPAMSSFNNPSKPFLQQKTVIEDLFDEIKQKFPTFYDEKFAPAPQTTLAAPLPTNNIINPPQNFQINFNQLLKSSTNIINNNQQNNKLKFNKINVKATYLQISPKIEDLQLLQNNLKLQNENGEVIFEEEVDFSALQKQFEEESGSQVIDFDRLVRIEPGQVTVDRLICAELNKQLLVKLYNVDYHEQLKQLIEKQGWLFGCYQEQSGLLIFRIPKS